MAGGGIRGHVDRTQGHGSSVDLFEDSQMRERIRAEFKESTRNHVYKGYIPDGPPPLPKEK
jgi:hypothetical protein